jgi:bacterioferritin
MSTPTKTHPEVLDLLNEILTSELTAVNQYFIHAKMCQNWGYHRLHEKIRAESIDEMKHADALIERILYLGGVPNMQRLFKINVGETVPEQLKLDHAVEKEAIARFNKGVEVSRTHGDNGSRHMLEEMLTSEEAHFDWIEAQLTLIEQVGESNYLAQQIRS